ncbi:MAG: PCMD domain-containing protein [Bacteroidaceae bacterium]
MKKITTLLMGATLLLTTSVQAQQIKGDLDADWVKDTKGNGALPGKYLRPGIQPLGWEASNVNQKVLMSMSMILVTPDANKTGTTGNSAKMENKYVGVMNIGSNAPAYITLGTPWVFGVSDIPKCDGGTIGGAEFTYRPDSLVGYYKRTIGSKGSEPALILSYLWKGTSVSTVKTNPKGNLSSSSTTQVQDQDLCILGKKNADSGNAQLIGKAEYNIEGTLADWTRIAVPMEYSNNEIPEKVNIVLSSANYWNRGAIKAENILWADDVVFAYNSKLTSLSIDGTPLNGFDKNKFTYTNLILGDAAPQIVAVSDGKGATVTVSALANNKITIVVKGNDYNTNSTNVHTYTLEFDNSTSIDSNESSLVKAYAADGTINVFGNESEEVLIYTVQGILVGQYAASETAIQTNLSKGIYIVKIGNYTTRIVL